MALAITLVNMSTRIFGSQNMILHIDKKYLCIISEKSRDLLLRCVNTEKLKLSFVLVKMNAR